jgi:tRNA(Ile)-lysidine synthase
LLDVVCRWRDRCITKGSPVPTINTIHIHHGLSDHADAWANHCQRLCERYKTSLQCHKVKINSHSNIELLAREVRYQVFESCLESGQVLFQGHHLNDQAETFFYRAVRGAGVKGLASIPFSRSLGKGVLIRPLLNVSREAIFQYARSRGLSWVEDESNQDTHFDRNFIRHKLIDPLSERWPHALERVAQAARYCRESESLNADLALIDLAELNANISPFSVALDKIKLCRLSRIRQVNVLRFWLREIGLGYPGEKNFMAIWQDLLSASPGASPIVVCPEGELRADEKFLYGLSKLHVNAINQERPQNFQIKLDLKSHVQNFSLTLPLGVLQFTRIDQPIRKNSLEKNGILLMGEILNTSLVIRFRRGGERMTVHGESVSRPLKVHFQRRDIPVWDRPFTPLLYVDDNLVALADRAITANIDSITHAKRHKGSGREDLGWHIQWLIS